MNNKNCVIYKMTTSDERLILGYIQRCYNAPNVESKSFDGKRYISIARNRLAVEIGRNTETVSQGIKSLQQKRLIDIRQELVPGSRMKRSYVRSRVTDCGTSLAKEKKFIERSNKNDKIKI